MNSAESAYWRARRDELLEQLADDETDLNTRLESVYEREIAKLEHDIAAYYQKYGTDNVIEYRKLLSSLSDEDRRLLMERMDEFADRYPQYAHLMPVRESIYTLNELEGIQTAIRIQQLEIGAIEQEEMRKHFERQAQRGANFAAEQMGFGQNFYTLNAEVVVETVGAAWASGESFSERIWDNREKLASYLNDDFSKLIARGVAYDRCAKELSERFGNVSRRDAKRLVYTEGTFLFNEAQARVHESDFESYALSCVHDGRACKVCRELEMAQKSNPARFSERMPGVNFPPLHPWCRCSYTVEIDDWEKWIDNYVAARGGDNAALRDPLRDVKDEAGIVNLKLRSERDKEVFENALSDAKAANKNGGSVDWHPASEMLGWDTLLSADSMAGVAVKGDGDITCVFKNPNSKARGAVTDLILMAREHGGVKMDCYGRFLVNSYEKCGYEVVARVPFDAEYVDDPLLLERQPDVFFLRKNGKSTAEVIEDIKNNSYVQSTAEELDALPTFDYEKAWEYRDNLL